jgi:penicillin-binding protein 2
VAQDKENKNLKVSKKNQDHALFVTYAPADKPIIAIGIIVENAGHGGSVAAPIAKKVMDAWILGHATKKLL